MTRGWHAHLLTALAFGVALGFPSVVLAGSSDVEIVIEPGRVQPETASTTTSGQVAFVNRSGRSVHVEFLGGDAGRHHVVHVPGRIWAIFHRTGRHPYAVHFYDSSHRDLTGTVEVTSDPDEAGWTPTCGWLTVEEVCIEP